MTVGIYEQKVWEFSKKQLVHPRNCTVNVHKINTFADIRAAGISMCVDTAAE